jgi:acyl-coenzyme A thioesterase PaaI-like protein
MDFDAMRNGLMQAIPFNSHVGLEIRDLREGTAVVALPDRPELRNHVGSQHAAALFAAGELASGGVLMSLLFERLSEVTPLAESADIEYKRIARGDILATARYEGTGAELFERIDADGKVRFEIPIELTDAQDRTVAHMTVKWHVGRNRTEGE